MTRWPTRPLGEVVLPTEQRNPELSPSDEFSYVDISSVDNEVKVIAAPKSIVGRDAPSRARKVIRAGDVIVATVRPNLNAVALVPRELDNQICSTGFSVLRPSKSVLSGYLFAFVRSRVFIDHLVARTTGANYPAVNDGEIKDVPLPVPSLAEQERVVMLVNEADALRKLRAHADQRMSQLIPALFNDMFGDPATNAKCWPLRAAGDLMAACDYGTSQKANEEARGIPVLRMGNVMIDGGLNLDDLKTVELESAELDRQRLCAGDVLFNRTNSRELVGKTGMWDGRFDAVAASYFIRIRFDPEVEHPQHFTTFMNLPFMKRRLAEIARGAVGQANINSKELKAIPVPVAPLPLQLEFAQRVKEIRELETHQAASSRRLDDLFQATLHRAFQGEL